jgi:ubiquinone/menaquinone biosynthesis C-methylase UbiE
MDHFKELYATDAEAYDALVCREDCDGNLLPALQRIVPLAGLEVVELGAGSGRLTRMLAPHVRRIDAFDESQAMLAAAAVTLGAWSNWTLQLAPNRSLPVPPASADLVLAGWAIGHAVDWYPLSWREEVLAALSEMERACRPRGRAVILETMGTGQERPAPPSAGLAAYYQLLADQGFEMSWVRTDYRFESLEEARRLTERFFCRSFAFERRAGIDGVFLPECTGVWSRDQPPGPE